MNSFLLPQFLELYRALPESFRQQVRQAYSLFQQDHIIRGCVSGWCIPLVRSSRHESAYAIEQWGFGKVTTSRGSGSALTRITIICCANFDNIL